MSGYFRNTITDLLTAENLAVRDSSLNTHKKNFVCTFNPWSKPSKNFFGAFNPWSKPSKNFFWAFNPWSKPPKNFFEAFNPWSKLSNDFVCTFYIYYMFYQ
jgi:hypothetical protein